MQLRPRSRRGGLGLFAILVAGALACGGEASEVDAPVDTADPRATPRSESAEPQNSAPQVHSVRFEPEDPTSGAELRAIVDAVDAEGDSLWLTYRWTLAGLDLDGNTDRISLRGVSKGDRIEVSVSASDGKTESEPANAWTDVENSPPRFERVDVEPADAIVSGTQIVVTPDARDADGDALTFSYRWRVNGREAAEKSAVLSTDRLRRGDSIQVEVVASDDDDASEPFSTPVMRIVNSAPEIVSSPGGLSEGGVFEYAVRAKDRDGDVALQYRLEQAPEGMSIHPLRGAIRWQPGVEQAGKHTVSVVVDDLQGGRQMQTFEITVAAADSESQPPAKAGN